MVNPFPLARAGGAGRMRTTTRWSRSGRARRAVPAEGAAADPAADPG